MSRDKHFPSDRELDDIKQLLDTRTIHIQLGANPDVDSPETNAVAHSVIARMRAIFGNYAVDNAMRSMEQAVYPDTSGSRAYQSMYDTALMRIWWEKFGDTPDIRRSSSDGETSGRLGADPGADANTPAQLHEERDGCLGADPGAPAQPHGDGVA